MYDWLRKAVDTNAVIVTANRRLSRELRRAYDDEQVAAGRLAWPTPSIVVLAAWVGNVLDDIADDSHALRISPSISASLWSQVARQHLPADLPAINGILQQCRSARDRLASWRVPVETVRERSYGVEHRQFARALTDYRKTLEQKNWIDDSGLIPVLLQELEAGRANLPERLVFAGFDRLSPLLSALVKQLQQRGCVVEVLGENPSPAKAHLARYADHDAEMRAAGAWARDEIENNPDIRVAVLRSDLDTDADNMARRLREGFAPGWQYAGSDYRRAVSVSYGRRLAEYPVIASALSMLQWVRGSLSSTDVGNLLCSGHFSVGESALLTNLELKLRDLPARLWRPANLVRAIGEEEGPGADWAVAMQPLVDESVGPEESQLPSRWAERFDGLLATLGWPGQQNLESEEFQLVNRWRELLNEFATLDLVEGQIGAGAAATRLAQLAAEAVYQSSGRDGALPLMGVLEAAGFEFDKVLLCGFDSNRWPLPGRPLTLVPRQLQRDFEMPDASDADSLAFSRRVLKRICASAKEVYISYAEQDEGVPQDLSSLAAEFDQLTDIDGADPGWHAASQTAAATESLDADIPPVAAGDRVYGGAYTVQRQHTEPFSGFAAGRLGVRELRPYQRGFSTMARGRLVHDALHKLYADLPGREDLAEWSSDDIQERSAHAAEEALKRYLRQADEPMRRFVALEKERLERMLKSLVAEDLGRSSFQIAELEEAYSLRHQHVEIRLRIDRIDQDAAQVRTVIDYKTGSEKKLYTEREKVLNDLQLAVYALALDGDIGGLALYNVNSSKISLSGSERLAEFHDVLDGWMAEARRALDGIARGDARVNTKISRSDSRVLAILSRHEELRDD